MSEFRELVEQMMANHADIDSDVVDDGYDTWSLAHLMQQDLSSLTEAIKVDHPSLGTGVVTTINESGTASEIQWDRMDSWIKGTGTIALEEASRIVVLNSPKYLRDQEDLSEETDMKDIDLTADDYAALMEDNYLDVPRPSDSILTKQSEFGAGDSKPLSGMDGDGGATNEPREEDGTPQDAPDTPDVASMDEPSRKAKIAKGGGGGGSNQFKKTTSSKSDDTSSSDDNDDSNEDDDMSKKNESFTFEDADLEGIEEMNHMDEMGDYEEGDAGMDEGSYMEHDMAAGEIAVTKEFMTKLISAACAASLDDSKIDMIVDCVADCCDEDRTLDVADIGTVMSKLKDKVGAGDDEAAADPAGDEFAGPEDDTDLMGDDDVEECGSDMEEGSEESRQRGRAKYDNRKMDKSRQRGDGGSKPKYRKPRTERPVEEGELPDALKKHQKEKGSDTDGDDKVNESTYARRAAKKARLDEAWMMGIPNVGNPREKASFEGMSEEEIELAELRRLSGM